MSKLRSTTGSARHLRGIVIAAVVVLVTASPQLAAGAVTTTSSTPAGVAPAGAVTVHVTSGAIKMELAGEPATIGPFTGTLTGTVAASGTLAFSKAKISFSTATTTLVLPAEITPAAGGDWTGTIDPASGSMSLSGSLALLVTVEAVGLKNCPIGPSPVGLSTAASGGAKYSTSGTATITATYNAAAIVTNPQNDVACANLESLMNTRGGLPQSGPMSWKVSTSPVLSGSGTAPPTTTTTTTTTTTAPPTTPAPPPTIAPAGNALPRTGGSSGPLVIVALAMVAVGIALMRPRSRRAAG